MQKKINNKLQFRTNCIVKINCEGNFREIILKLFSIEGSSIRSTQLKVMCSMDDKPTDPIYSSSNYMTIKFRTDVSLNYRGFLMSVQPGIVFLCQLIELVVGVSRILGFVLSLTK